jgi:predicted lipid-binding transport protein (Tim44 family)
MLTTLIDTCPLCGLRFSNRPLLELHIREDHVQARDRRADSPAPAGRAPDTSADDHPDSRPTAELRAAEAMAKALLGHVGGPDPRTLSEMRRLRQRVRELETELAAMRQENDVAKETPVSEAAGTAMP